MTSTAEEKRVPDPNATILDTSQGEFDRNRRPECFKSTFQEVLVISTASMAVCMSSLLQGVINVNSSFIEEDLNMTTAQTTWLTASLSLASGAFLLFFGKVADMFGRRYILLISLFLYAVFALVAGFSQAGITLDILNGVLGLMCAASVPSAQGILGRAYAKPSRRKNYAFACFAAGAPLGFVFGTIFGGIAAEIFNWRAAYFLVAIIFLIVTIIAFFAVPNDDSTKMPLTLESLKKFDILGTALAITGIGLFCTALTLGGDADDGFRTPHVLVFLLIGLALMAAFIFWELRCKHPLIPMSIFSDREFSLIVTILALGFMAFPPMSFWIALYMQRVRGYSALSTAVHFLPMAINGIVVNVAAGLLLHRVSNKLLMAIGASAYTVSFLLLAVNRVDTSYWALMFPALLLVVVGADLEFNVANMYTLSSLPSTHQSIAGSLFQTITRLSVSLGVAISTAIFNGVTDNPADSGFYAGDPGEGYAMIFWFCTGVAAVSVVLVPWLRIGVQGN